MFAWLLLPVLLSPRLAEPPPVVERTVRVEFQSAESTQMGDGPVHLVSANRTLDLMVGFDGRFRGRVVIDNEIITVKGKLTSQPDGSAGIELVADQLIPPVKSSQKSGVIIPLGQQIMLGSSEGKSTTDTGEGIIHKQWKQRLLLTVLDEPPE